MVRDDFSALALRERGRPLLKYLQIACYSTSRNIATAVLRFLTFSFFFCVLLDVADVRRAVLLFCLSF